MKRDFIVNHENMCNYFYTLENKLTPLLNTCVQNTIQETLLALTMTIFDEATQDKDELHKYKEYLTTNPHMLLAVTPVYTNFVKRILGNVGIFHIPWGGLLQWCDQLGQFHHIKKTLSCALPQSNSTAPYALALLYWGNCWLNDTSTESENTLAMVDRLLNDMLHEENNQQHNVF